MAHDRGMTVKELIEELQGFPPDAPVHLAYGYGDRVRTTCADGVATVGQDSLVYSEYHNTFKVTERDEDETFLAVVLEG